MLMKVVGMIDLSQQAVDHLLAGVPLYHSMRRITKVGLSGFRALARSGDDPNASVAKAGPLDRFKAEGDSGDRDPMMTLFD